MNKVEILSQLEENFNFNPIKALENKEDLFDNISDDDLFAELIDGLVEIDLELYSYLVNELTKYDARILKEETELTENHNEMIRNLKQDYRDSR